MWTKLLQLALYRHAGEWIMNYINLCSLWVFISTLNWWTVTPEFTSLTNRKPPWKFWPLRGWRAEESKKRRKKEAMIAYQQYNFLCSSKICSTTEQWFVDSYETGGHGACLLSKLCELTVSLVTVSKLLSLERFVFTH